MAIGSNNPFPSVLFAEGSVPSTPAAGFWRAYFKTDGMYVIDDAGVEYGPIVAVPDASDTAAGIVELATNAEVATGTDALRAVTPAAAASVYIAQTAVATGSRPSASTAGAGATVFDTTLGQPIWSDGTNWVDATGTTV